MRALRVIVTAAIVLGSLMMVPSPAGAVSAFAVECSSTQNWSFSPSLTTSFVSNGSTSQSYSNNYCAQGGGSAGIGSVWPVPVSQYSDVYHSPWTFNTGGGYTGSCTVAFVYVGFWGNPDGLLIGGSVLVGGPFAIGSSEFGEVYVLAPLLAPCLESSATGGGVAYGAGASA